MEIPDGYTPIYRGDKVIGAYGKIEGPVIVQLANQEANDIDKARFEGALRRELSDFLKPDTPFLFE